MNCRMSSFPTHKVIMQLLLQDAGTVLPVAVTIVITTYRIVSFFEALKFHKWPIFNFFTILLSQLGLPKWAIIWSNYFSRS